MSSDDASGGAAQGDHNLSLIALLTAIGTGIIASAVQILIFILIKNKLVRIFQPKTYLVPERQRTTPPPRSPFGWMISIFKYKDKEIINKCGLDAYFFLRYLQTLLIIFIPLACLLLPILLPINYIGGRNTADFSSTETTADDDLPGGLDTLAWGNISPTETHRYWAHLILAVVVVIWVCYVFFAELRVYIRIRQDYLTSAEHRLRASATTVLVTAIPDKWLTVEALSGLYDVFPGGIRNIWVNRNYDPLLEKVREREEVVSRLESAETELIRECKKAQLKQQAKDKRHTTKEDKEREANEANLEAARIAQGEGVSAGDPHQVHHTVEEAVDDDDGHTMMTEPRYEGQSKFNKVPIIGGGLAAVGKGFGRGLELVGRAGENVFEGTKHSPRDVNDGIESTNGFVKIDNAPEKPALQINTAANPAVKSPPGRPSQNDGEMTGAHITRSSDTSRSIPPRDVQFGQSPDTPKGFGERRSIPPRDVQFGQSPDTPKSFGERRSIPPRDVQFGQSPDTPKGFGEHRNIKGPELDQIPYSFGSGDIEDSKNSWWKFWNGPSGGFPSPLPHGYERDDSQKRNFGQMVTSGGKQIIAPIKSLFEKNEGPKHEYPAYVDPDYKEDVPGEALWEKYIKKSDRPTLRLPRFGITLLPYILPWVNKKVDAIYWCREELARLNAEIEYDQAHLEDYPRMNSAFIQFNHQIAAHMAAQAVSHHIPKHMAPRMVEVSPTDVIWGNMSIKWWESWLRTGASIGVVSGMCVLWAIPVSATTLLGNIPALINQYRWLSFLEAAEPALKPIAGVLPAIVLTVLMALPPMIFYKLATLQGNQTGKLRELSVQNYYFYFLFIQVFLVVSVASGTFATLAQIADVTTIPALLAQNLPKASNYFFSYMIIQALSTSAGNLLQVGTLIMWLLMPKIADNTARQKWRRNTKLSTVKWGRYFPTYTNFACIALIYSTVAPLIMVFAIITFTVLWIANRYSMLYVYKHTEDTGGLLYPRAINQTFVGLYVMELCLIGLFFLVRDNFNKAACAPQAVIMIVVLVLTALFQILLNQSFGPLYEHLPITLEDDAVIRDEAFERAQAAKFRQDADSDDDNDIPYRTNSADSRDENIELRKLRRTSTNHTRPSYAKFDPRKGLRSGAAWATKSARTVGEVAFGDPDKVSGNKKRIRKDVEAQKLMGEALFGGYNDEIEDLTPEERDTLVRVAFQHEALRARRPNIWLPRDDLGVSDEEVLRTEQFGMGHIWITNKGTALDSKVRVMYGKNPPDFSELDLIVL